MAALEGSLAATVVRLLSENSTTLAVAESSTGGLIGHLLTEVPGSSAVFFGGVIAYHNDAKEKLLGVPEPVLATEGAVSAGTAGAMAEGARRLFGADIGIGVSGIAGPTGATAAKPVGLTYVALSAEGMLLCEQYVWTGSRSENKRSTAKSALEMVRRYLEG